MGCFIDSLIEWLDRLLQKWERKLIAKMRAKSKSKDDIWYN